MAVKKWVVRDADKERASAISEKFNIDPFIAFLLASRGISDDLSVSSFFSDSYEMISPFRFADMEEASFVIGDAIDNGLKICVYGDYDCDGVTATALLYSFLKKEGADVCYYIPDRCDEGYGLNLEAVEKMNSMGVELIVTVDNGISAVDEAERIYELGMSLVITDHHQLSEKMPRAEAIVNPHREDNDLTFRDYCGVGVAFKLACAMAEDRIDELVDEYIDLVAIGTIADLMPLTDENRALVRAGINKINNNPSTAVRAFSELGSKNNYSSTEIAFRLCPRINAMGRMGDASRAVEFLISEDYDDALMKAEQLNVENSARKETEDKIINDINRQLEANPSLEDDRIIVIAGKNYHYGVIGIVASHIVERTGKPAFVIGIDENGIANGSARSVDNFNIYEAISACSDLLIRFGGHPLASGITLKEENISSFRRRINEFAYSKYKVMPAQELLIDCRLSPFYLNLDLVDNLSALEPCGTGNPQAIFGIYNMSLVSVTSLSEGKHIRLEVEKKGKKIKVVKFGMSIDEFPYVVGDKLNLAVKISKNFYSDKTYLSVQAVDIRLSDTDDEKYFSEKNDYDLFRVRGVGSEKLYPNRAVCAVIYRFLKANNGYSFGLDNLYFRLQRSVNYSQLMFALEAFSQAGLINFDGEIKLRESLGKVNLDATEALTQLRSKLV